MVGTNGSVPQLITISPRCPGCGFVAASFEIDKDAAWRMACPACTSPQRFLVDGSLEGDIEARLLKTATSEVLLVKALAEELGGLTRRIEELEQVERARLGTVDEAAG